MQPCIGSAGSEGLPPPLVSCASVTHLPAETWEGNVSKQAFQNGACWANQEPGGGGGREGGVCSFQLVTINKS